MGTLKASAMPDLIKATLRELGRGKIIQVAQDLTCYEVIGRWFKKDLELQEGGYGLQRTLQMSTGGTFRNKGRYARDTTNRPNLLEQLRVDFVSADVYWTWEYVSDYLMNKGKSKVVDTIQSSRNGAIIDMADGLETNGWSLPVAGNAEDKEPYGIPYWVVQNASTGFNGGAPSGYTTVGNINPTDFPKWKNYTYTYTARDRASMIKPLRTMHRNINWKSPTGVKEYRKAVDLRIYTDEVTVSAMEDIGEGQNESLGKDLSPYNAGGRDVNKYDGDLVFKRHPIIYSPWLTENTTNNPIYMIDHGTFMPVVLKGDNMRESDPIRDEDSHDVWKNFIDLSYNFVCLDRRRNGVAYYSG